MGIENLHKTDMLFYGRMCKMYSINKTKYKMNVNSEDGQHLFYDVCKIGVFNECVLGKN